MSQKNSEMGHSRKNPNRGLRIYFFGNPLEFYFTPGKSRQNKAQPLDISQNCIRSLGNSASFLINPLKFHRLFLWYPWKLHILNLPCLGFFWSSPICISLLKNHWIQHYHYYFIIIIIFVIQQSTHKHISVHNMLFYYTCI